MKKIFLILFVCVMSIGTTVATISGTTQISEDKMSVVAKNGSFKLYPTDNTYCFLRLDTRNGRIWQVRWHPNSEKRLVSDLSPDKKINADEIEIPYRFELYSVVYNHYIFILLDTQSGRMWQVQWHDSDEDKRAVDPLP